MVTFGTNPGMVVGVNDPVPDAHDASFRKALEYMQVTPGKPMSENPVDVVFVGSCTNGRLVGPAAGGRDPRGPQGGGRRAHAGRARLAAGQAAGGSSSACDRIFAEAGAEWRESGCSMCLGMNGDTVPSGQLSVSTSNRNFEGRQGIGARTVLASPATAAASAVMGRVTDPRKLT